MPEKKETLSDKLLNKVKDNKIVAYILIIAFALTVFETITGKFESLWERFSPAEEVIDVKMRYYYFRGHSISMLMQGELTEKFQKILGGTPVVQQNKIYKELQEIENMYGHPTREHDGYMLIEDNEEGWINDYHLDLPVLPGTFKFYKTFRMNWDYFKKEVTGFPTDLSDGWEIVLRRDPNCVEDCEESLIDSFFSGEIPVDAVSFKRRISREEALIYFKISGGYGFYKFITSKGCPDDFFSVILNYDGCWEEWIIDIDMPLMALQSLIIENISGTPVKISELKGTINGEIGIVKESANLKFINEFEETVADGVFGVDELLIVPLNIIFSRKKDHNTEFGELDYAPLPKLVYDEAKKHIEEHETFQVVDYRSRFSHKEDIVIKQIPRLTMASLFNNRNKKPPTEEYFYISTIAESVKINGRRKEIHPFDEGSMFISHGSEAGSCPYVFDQSGKSLGNVLTGRNSQIKEGVYSKVLSRGENQFEFMELENEISYIKWVRLKCTSQEGEVWYLEPEEELLKKGNDKYVILNKGESYEVNFNEKRLGDTSELEVFGYYEPY